jgi:hypothetical protein
LLQVGIIPTGSKTFVFYTNLERVVVFQQAQGRAAKDAEVGVSVAATQARLILLEGYIELPMQAIPFHRFRGRSHVATHKTAPRVDELTGGWLTACYAIYPDEGS